MAGATYQNGRDVPDVQTNEEGHHGGDDATVDLVRRRPRIDI